MAAYTLTTPTIANGNGGIPHISGRGLRRRRLSRQDRVRLAADVIAREAQLDLSIRQASDLLNVAATEVGAERCGCRLGRTSQHCCVKPPVRRRKAAHSFSRRIP